MATIVKVDIFLPGNGQDYMNFSSADPYANSGKMHFRDLSGISRLEGIWLYQGFPYRLPLHVAQTSGQTTCPFGDAALQFQDALLAVETCEELFTPMAPNIRLALSGTVIPVCCEQSLVLDVAASLAPSAFQFVSIIKTCMVGGLQPARCCGILF